MRKLLLSLILLTMSVSSYATSSLCHGENLDYSFQYLLVEGVEYPTALYEPGTGNYVEGVKEISVETLNEKVTTKCVDDKNHREIKAAYKVNVSLEGKELVIGDTFKCIEHYGPCAE